MEFVFVVERVACFLFSLKTSRILTDRFRSFTQSFQRTAWIVIYIKQTTVARRRHPRGGRMPGCILFPCRNFSKNTDFFDIMISSVLRDLSFSRKQPLTSADDWHIIIRIKVKILKNKIRNLGCLI